MIRKVLACSSLFLIIAACGNRSSLGSGDDNLGEGGSGNTPGNGGASGSGGGYDPCAGKPCGAECSVCPPSDPSCNETTVLKFCDATGACGSAYPECKPQQCTDVDDCAVATAPCEPCPDGSYACTTAACVDGQCVIQSETCGGQQCTDAGDCPVLEAPCQQCSDGTIACPTSDCVNGVCVGSFPGCPGYEPCAGKACGDTCTQCPPNDPSCVETAVLKYCAADGSCGAAFPTCGGSGQCTSTADCPMIELCLGCADGSCAEPACVNGKCDLVCAPPTTPQCTADLDCPQIELCKTCSNGSCADIKCVNGSCQFVCI